MPTNLGKEVFNRRIFYSDSNSGGYSYHHRFLIIAPYVGNDLLVLTNILFVLAQGVKGSNSGLAFVVGGEYKLLYTVLSIVQTDYREYTALFL